MSSPYNTSSIVRVSRAVTRGEPRRKRKPAGLKPREWEHWKLGIVNAAGRWVWFSSYAKNGEKALRAFLAMNPNVERESIQSVIFVEIVTI